MAKFTLSKITVEPFMFLCMKAFFLSFVTLPQIILDNVCLRKHNETMCKAMFTGAFKQEFDVVQEESTLWFGGLLVIATFITILTLPFVGTMSDQFGRYPAMFLSPVSQLVQTLAFIVIVFNGLRFPTWLLLLAGPIPGLVGDISGLYVLTGSYISDITNEKNRTLRITLLEASGMVAGLSATVSSGFIIEGFGYIAIFVTDIGLLILALLYLIFCVKPVTPTVDLPTNLKEGAGLDENEIDNKPKDGKGEENHGFESSRKNVPSKAGKIGTNSENDNEIDVKIDCLYDKEGSCDSSRIQSAVKAIGSELTGDELAGDEVTGNELYGSKLAGYEGDGGEITKGAGTRSDPNGNEQVLDENDIKGDKGYANETHANTSDWMDDLAKDRAGNGCERTGNEDSETGSMVKGNEEMEVEKESSAQNTGHLSRSKLTAKTLGDGESLAFKDDDGDKDSLPIIKATDETEGKESAQTVLRGHGERPANPYTVMPEAEMKIIDEEELEKVSVRSKIFHIVKESNPIRNFVRVRAVLKAEGQVVSGLSLLLLMGFTATSYSGEMSVVALFLKNRPYFLSARALGIFLAVESGMIAIFGMVAINYLFTKVLKLDDHLILLIGFFSYTVYFMLLAFAQSLLMLYLIQIIHAVGSLCTSIIRAMLSKTVPPSSVGLLFGSLLMVETFGVLLGSMVCPVVYSSVAAFKPGAVFFVNAVLMLLAFFTTIYLLLRNRKKRQYEVDFVLPEDAKSPDY